MLLWRQESPPKEDKHLLHYYHKTLQARDTDHLQKSCCLSQFLFHIFSPTHVLHTPGDFKKIQWIVCGRWAVKECSACWSGFAFPKHRDLALWEECNSHLFQQKRSLLLQPKYESFSSFSQSRTCQVSPLSSPYFSSSKHIFVIGSSVPV